MRTPISVTEANFEREAIPPDLPAHVDYWGS